MSSNVRAGIIYEDPKTLEARRVVAKNCVKDLGLKLPTVLDDMDNAAMKAYNSWPNRVYIIGGDGIVAFKGKGGPRGVTGVQFEKALEEVLAAPGGGRFTDHRPGVGVLEAIPVDPDDVRTPEHFTAERAGDEIVLGTGRRGGATYEIDPEKTLASAKSVLAATGIFGRIAGGERVIPTSLVAIRADGKETKARKSKLFRLRYEHAYKNVRLVGDHVDVVFDKIGIREIRIAWHRVSEEANGGEGERVSSLQAARAEKMTKAVARLRYVRREGGDGAVVFRPVWRLTKGRMVRDVDVVK